VLRSYDRAMWLRRTRKGWAEPAPKRCANGHELRGGTVLVGTQHCDCGQIHRTHYCKACGDTVFTPPLVEGCRSRAFDER
jgi:hypothetical protein